MFAILASGRARWVVLAVAIGAALAGCGSSGTVQGGNDTYSATTLTVYSDLPLLGPDGAQMASIVDGEMLALYNRGGHVGKFHVSLESLNDYPDASVSDPLLPDPLRSARNQIGESAYTASSDLSTAAYIGDYDSAATAISLPLNNQNDILQISPGSPYVGFTDANAADLAGDPRAFDPYGTPTFARLVPSDAVEARAAVSWMRSLGVRRLALLSDDSNAPENFNGVIAKEVASDAAAAGITVVGDQPGIDTSSLSSPGDYARVASAVAAEHPDAILLGGSADAGAAALWQALHAAVPGAKLFAPSTLATPAFLRALGAAASATYVTSPILEPSQYPAAAQAVFAQYRRVFTAAPSVYVLYGYDAMNDILAAIAKAGRNAPSRPHLRSAFFALGHSGFKGTLGDYTIDAAGDTSLQRIDGYRVGAGGALVLAREIS
jgi:branched-chain amino acid transport system substrate-binding protein